MKTIDECLSTQNGNLYIEDCNTLDLIAQFGSPLFVFSEAQIRQNVHRFQTAFQAGWPEGDIKVMPAAKANWISAIQYILAEEGCGCDIYSPGELSVALQAGFDPAFISVNGVDKEEAHIYRCIQEGVRITIDSQEEVTLIEKAANELEKTAKVRLRLRPVLSEFTSHSQFVAEGFVPTDIAAMAYKGGLSFEDALSIGKKILTMKYVNLVGFHQHHGRHDPSLRYWRVQMIAFAKELGKICQALGGIQPQEIDIGGGFAIPRDPFNAATDYSEPLQLAAIHAISKGLQILGKDTRYKVLSKIIDQITSSPNKVMAPSIEEYAKVCTQTLREELPKQGINTKGLMLQLEPGRSLHGNTGIHLATVKNIKHLKSPIQWKIVVIDSTEFWFTGGRYEHHLHDYIFANKTDAPLLDKADIIGRSCYGDRLFPTVPIPQVELGDILAILDTGAYQEVSASNFNALPRPASVLVKGNTASVIRQRESEADVFQRDRIPDYLKRPMHLF